MPSVECVYGLHFNEMANKYKETFEFEGKAYKGFKEELVDPETGGLATTNQILIQRQEEKTHPLFSLDDEIRDGDILTFF
jgi:hypothetical protein